MDVVETVPSAEKLMKHKDASDGTYATLTCTPGYSTSQPGAVPLKSILKPTLHKRTKGVTCSNEGEDVTLAPIKKTKALEWKDRHGFALFQVREFAASDWSSTEDEDERIERRSKCCIMM